MTKFNKAVVSILGGLVTIVAAFGIDVSWATEGLIASVGMLITSGLVFLVPNTDA